MSEAIDLISATSFVFHEDSILGDVLKVFVVDHSAVNVRAFQRHGGLWIGDWADIGDIPVNLGQFFTAGMAL